MSTSQNSPFAKLLSPIHRASLGRGLPRVASLTLGLVVLCSASPEAAIHHASEPLLVLQHPEEVRALEMQGLSFAERLTGQRADSNAAIARGYGYERITQVLKRDLLALKRGDAQAGVGTRYPHRLFDHRWLTSELTRFELVAVVNRLDRAPLSEGGCGETRLVYRLAYTNNHGLSSRLPMTVNLVYWQRGKGCLDVAKRWQAVGSLRDTAGPLSDRHVTRAHLKSVEINLQSVRWPSTVHPSLGGHAEYVMRVFVPEGEGLRVGTLENTPDVRRLRRHPRLRAKLLAWLNAPANQGALATGNFKLPEEFLATKVTSVTPRGLARLANRPFSQLFERHDLDEIADEGMLSRLRKMDARTCSGCHQSRSIAGFHFPGEDPVSQRLDALAVGRSPHFIDDQVRRRRFMESVLAGQASDDARGHAEGGAFRGAGARCVDGAPLGTIWACAPPLVCGHIDDRELGTCMSQGELQVGEACEPGELKTRRVGHRDRMHRTADRDCAPGLHCETTAVGFPGGMCAGACDVQSPESVCGSIALLTPFNRCIASKRPFTRCLEEETRSARLARCDASTPCRDDYLCARIEGETGACIPPYFLFQMRVDGH